MKPRDVIAECVRIIRRHLPGNDMRIYLIGSRARSAASEGSDIDIAILAKKRIDGLVLMRIREEVKGVPTLRKIDIVDLGASDAEFKREALGHAKAL
ncbi:MAG: nucleotidyltransferase domain-containing protein [Elusimicrobia bacterium]|nr:nucleotidyltransferase domain-containing protein [Elusimicrobiota bacterium]